MMEAHLHKRSRAIQLLQGNTAIAYKGCFAAQCVECCTAQQLLACHSMRQTLALPHTHTLVI